MKKSDASTRSRRKKKRYDLWLYVAGQTPKSIAAYTNLKKICEEHLGNALARSGFAALLYWSPAMRDFRLDPENVENIALAYHWFTEQPYVDAARSGLLGTCVGGAFALMTAASSLIGNRVGFIGANAPYSSRGTESYRRSRRRDITPVILGITMSNTWVLPNKACSGRRVCAAFLGVSPAGNASR